MEIQTKHSIIMGDSRDMSAIKKQSVDLIITSPPYWQLKDYGHQNQIGYNDSYEHYINHLNLVWNECYHVMDNGARLCINIGDQYARSVYYGRYKIIPIRTEIIRFCEQIGLDYMGAIIWQKVATTNTTGGATIMGSYPYPRNGILKLDYEFILIFRKPGQSIKKISPEIKAASKLDKNEWNQYFSGHWNFSGAKQSQHLAMFPEELPYRLIKMFAFVNDTVLDPFLGSGTTSLAAAKLGRNSIGFEINKEFLPLIIQKLDFNNIGVQNAKIEFKEQQNADKNFEKEIERLPYIFKDPIGLNPKIDLKSKPFGSKIDKEPHSTENFFHVKKIISVTELVLNDGKSIKLAGICIKKGKEVEAKLFLSKKLKKQKVYFKTEPKSPENENWVYLYLKNKTFINAHLIKNGFAEADLDSDYKMKKKFIKLEQKQA